MTLLSYSSDSNPNLNNILLCEIENVSLGKRKLYKAKNFFLPETS